jgi:hypothetical protein
VERVRDCECRRDVGSRMCMCRGLSVWSAEPLRQRPWRKRRRRSIVRGDESKCVKGAKRLIVWNQKESVDDVVGVPDVFLAAPGYKSRCGFSLGAQNDIFEEGGEAPPPTSSVLATASASGSGSASASASGEFSILPVTPIPSPGDAGDGSVSIPATRTPVTHVADASSTPAAGGKGPPLPGTGTSPISFTST